MPELPEIETIVRSFHKVAKGGAIRDIQFFRPDLRSFIPQQAVKQVLKGHVIQRIFRRSKYILIETPVGGGIIHLGMSGKVLFSDSAEIQAPHTHAIFVLQAAKESAPRFLHYVDPRRFGMISAWRGKHWEQHELLVDLGVEPLEHNGLGAYLYQAGRKRSVSIKAFLMDAKIVVGVGNIYAAEALFRAQVRPQRIASSLKPSEYQRIAAAIVEVLTAAIAAGGTTFRDYRKTDGDVGSFAVSLAVYGCAGDPCLKCKTAIEMIRQEGRSSWFCPNCQR